MEESFVDVAKLSDPGSQVILLIDRGLLDLSVFTQPRTWSALLHDLGLTRQMLESRYDAVIHMVTAADGAEKHYNTWIRSEGFYQSADDARERDENLRQAYMAHRSWNLVSNTANSSFE